MRVTVGFSCTHDGDAISTDHSAIFDIEMPANEGLEHAIKNHVVSFQNSILRKMTAKAGAKFCRDNVITKELLYPGTRRARTIVMTDSQVKDMAKKDPEYRKQLLAELEAMEK